MTNIVHLHGAMHPRHYVRTKLSEADLDAQIAANRERHDAANEGRPTRPAPITTLSPPSVIPLGKRSPHVRLIRWARTFFLQLRSPL